MQQDSSQAAAAAEDVELQMQQEHGSGGSNDAHSSADKVQEVKAEDAHVSRDADPQQQQQQTRRNGRKPADKVVDGLAWFGGKVLAGIEFIGEIVANVLGLNDSRYQWVMDTMNEQEWEVARRNEEQRQAAAAAASMEGGTDCAVAPDAITETGTEASFASENATDLNA